VLSGHPQPEFNFVENLAPFGEHKQLELIWLLWNGRCSKFLPDGWAFWFEDPYYRPLETLLEKGVSWF
jgi:hypothetical protein